MSWDATLSGSISGGGTTANISAKVSCDNSVPAGEVYGKVKFFTGKFYRKVCFSSDSPMIVITRKTGTLQSIGAVFAGVTVVDETCSRTYEDCMVYLTAARLNSGSWIGSYTIVCPDDLNLFVYGVFTGSVSVNRQVFCRLLL